MSALLLFAASFTCVFTLGLQQMNVTAGKQGLAFLTAFAIGGTQLVLFKVLPGPTTWLEIFAFLFGGACGVTVSMEAHPHLLRLVERYSVWINKANHWLGAEEATDQELEEVQLIEACALIRNHCLTSDHRPQPYYDLASLHRRVDDLSADQSFARLDAAVELLEKRGYIERHPYFHAHVRFI